MKTMMKTQPEASARNEQSVASEQRGSTVTCVLLMLGGVALWLLTAFTPAHAVVPAAGGVDAGGAASLSARHDALREQLASNPFQRPLVLESTQTPSDVKGDIYAVVKYPFAQVHAALAEPQAWCEILILHLNTKFCNISREEQGAALHLNVGKKFDQPLDQSYRLDFAWKVAQRSSAYVRVLLSAETGPVSTRDYRITLEAVPLENGRTFLHLSYAYGYGLTGKLAMAAYFSTLGRNKVGFSSAGNGPDGLPAFVDGMRGQLERNTMRYYLAIESFLGAIATPKLGRFEKSINDWFTAVERYPRQLHEMGREEYLDMKRKEYLRQQPEAIARAAGLG